MNSLREYIGAHGKIVEDSKRIEFKVDHHLQTFPEDFISPVFCRKVRPFIEVITLTKGDYSSFKGLDNILSFKMGDTVVSYDAGEILVKGRNFYNMIKALNIFYKYKDDATRFDRELREKIETEEKLRKARSCAVTFVKGNVELRKKIKALEKPTTKEIFIRFFTFWKWPCFEFIS
jgi:hypothetical protein